MKLVKDSNKFLSLKPTKLSHMINQKKQLVFFYEHPELGEDAPIYGEINGKVFDTEFFDLDDMMAEHGEYAPILLNNGTLGCYFEVEEQFLLEQKFLVAKRNVLAQKVLADNLAIEKVNKELPQVVEHLAKFAGKKITKADGSIMKAAKIEIDYINEKQFSDLLGDYWLRQECRIFIQGKRVYLASLATIFSGMMDNVSGFHMTGSEASVTLGLVEGERFVDFGPFAPHSVQPISTVFIEAEILEAATKAQDAKRAYLEHFDLVPYSYRDMFDLNSLR